MALWYVIREEGVVLWHHPSAIDYTKIHSLQVLCLVSATWDNAAGDDLITTTAKNLNNQIIAAAKASGLWNKWVYLNYADVSQDPIAGYGAMNAAKLKAVSKKYDPGQMFQKNVPGGFKLFE